MKVYNYSFQSF